MSLGLRFLGRGMLEEWVVFYIRVPLRVVFRRVPYHLGDPKKDPNLENYP